MPKKPIGDSLNTAHQKNAVIDALEQSLGVVTRACKIANVGRRTFYEWMGKDPDFAQRVREVENIALDFVESQLFKQIKEGNTAATIFYLKTKGKKRGYVEKQNINVNVGTGIGDLPDADLEERVLQLTQTNLIEIPGESKEG